MKTCFLDFDRTIQELACADTDSNFLNENCIKFAKMIKELGYKVVLNTFRADLKNGSLEQVLQSIETLIEFDDLSFSLMELTQLLFKIICLNLIPSNEN